jgi:aromatic-L-amino-acid decarboxylase
MSERHPLEPDRATRERWLEAVSGFVQQHLDGLEDAPAVGVVGTPGNRIGAEVSVGVQEEPLAGGIDEALERLGRAVDASLNTAGPGYLAYIPGGGIHAAALADYWANSTNRFTGLTAAAPGLARLEWDVLAWLAQEFGYGEAARGLLTSGGSLGSFSAIVTAREDKLGEGADLREAVAYTSTQAHHCVLKCLRLAGFPRETLRLVPVDERRRMDASALDAMIAEDRAAGRRPFLVVAAAGTTNTGAVDPLPAIADTCEGEGLWLHVDGAYGGAFVLCDEGRARLAGIERADSIVMDPHKGMFLPYGTGCLLVRDGDALHRAHVEGAAYLQDFDAWEREGEAPSPTEHGPELSRDYRGLRLWLPLALHGARAFRDQAAEKLELAERIDAGLAALAEQGAPLEIVDRAQLSISSFRLRRGEGETLGDWNARNAALMAGVNSRKRVYITSTALPVEDGEAFTLRTCVLSFRTHALHCDRFLEDLAAALEDVE